MFFKERVCDEWGGAESRGNGARPVEWMIMNDTCATHRSRVPRRSFGRNKRRSDDIGTRDRWVAQVSFIIIHSTGLAPFPRLSAPPHSSQCSCLLDTWKKETQGSHYFSFFALSNLLTQSSLHFCTQQLFFWTLLLKMFPSLCSHTVFWCSLVLNKTVFIYIFDCFCCQTTGWIWNRDWNATH